MSEDRAPPPTTVVPSRTTAPAGNLSRYWGEWETITNNNFVLQIVKSGYKIQFQSNPNFASPIISNPKSSEKRVALLGEVDSHLSSGVISPVASSPDQFVSRVFTVKKASGENRLIIDLKELNFHVNKVHFRMEDKQAIKDLIHEGDFLASIDLKDAFFSIALHPDSKKFTVFQIGNQRFCFNVLPFGLSSSPRIFTKLLKVVILHLRSIGIKISAYLDDIFLAAKSKDLLLLHLKSTIDLLCNLGFSINPKKSQLFPSQFLKHLGFNFDSINMIVSLPNDKIEKIKSFAASLLRNPSPSLRELSAFIGLAISCKEGFLYAPLHYRGLQKSLINSDGPSSSWDSLTSLGRRAIVDLEWWQACSLSDLTPVPIKIKKSSLSLYCDASNSGWGAWLSSDESISGTWSPEESELHINFLELKTVYLAISQFSDILKDKIVTIFSDNTTAVQYLRRMGGTHSFSLCSLALDIYALIISNNISIIPMHIAGTDNNIADFFSRYSHLHEYSLSQNAFDALTQLIPFDFSMDTFASNKNKKLPKFVSLANHPNAFRVNAFSFPWPNGVYMFPPIPLISKCLHKFVSDEVKFGLLITPAWPSIVKLPTIISLLFDDPILIPASHLEGCLLTRYPFNTMAWPLSTCSVRIEAYQLRLQRRCSAAFPQTPSKLIAGCGQPMLDGLRSKGIRAKYLYL